MDLRTDKGNCAVNQTRAAHGHSYAVCMFFSVLDLLAVLPYSDLAIR